MEPDVRNNIESYIEKLREELIQEIQGMNSETNGGDTASSLSMGSFESSLQENIGCSSKFSQCAK
ncbi:MAG TPA: hypothetical protein VFH91_06425 [Pyrinomonadaceae bacterium]|nr:hypothetical protein [Pyrinomonadaceae bacterium]